MIAAAMKTRPEEALLFMELARQGACVSRQLLVTELPRLASLLVPVDEDEPTTVSVSLDFSLGDKGHALVRGRVVGRFGLRCHGCYEDFPHPLALDFECAIVASEAMAIQFDAWAREAGERLVPLVADGEAVTVAQIVEDEIILSLPERLCERVPCDHRPQLVYPATPEMAEPSVTGQSEAGNPFAQLAALKGKVQTNREGE